MLALLFKTSCALLKFHSGWYATKVILDDLKDNGYCCPWEFFVFTFFSITIGEFWFWAAAAAAKSLQSSLTLCDPTDGSPPGSPVPGILQARTLELVDISFSNVWKWKVKVRLLSHVRLFETPWTVAYEAPPSMGFSRQEYWSGLPLPSPWFWAVEDF